MISFIDLKAQRARLGRRIDDALLRVVDSGRFILGPEVEELERQLAVGAGVSHCIGCASGTDALLLALMARRIGPGDAVFVPAFTFVATAEVVALTGATPVFVDVREDDFNLDPASLAVAIDASVKLGLRPRAAIPVDLYGQPADYPAIAAVAAAAGLFVIADAAQSFGGSLDGVPVGRFGDVTATSFYPSKPLGCYGDGGAVLTDDAELATTMRSLRAHGEGGHPYDNVRIGINGRLDALQAAVLLEKLAIFNEEIAARQRIAARYGELLARAVRVPQPMPGRSSVWAQYTILSERRDKIAAECQSAGVPTSIHYPIPLTRQAGYRHYPCVPGGVPVSEGLAARVLSLPMHPYLDEATQDRIVVAVTAGAEGRN